MKVADKILKWVWGSVQFGLEFRKWSCPYYCIVWQQVHSLYILLDSNIFKYLSCQMHTNWRAE